MQGIGHADYNLQVPGNEADAVPCEPLRVQAPLTVGWRWKLTASGVLFWFIDIFARNLRVLIPGCSTCANNDLKFRQCLMINFYFYLQAAIHNWCFPASRPEPVILNYRKQRIPRKPQKRSSLSPRPDLPIVNGHRQTFLTFARWSMWKNLKFGAKLEWICSCSFVHGRCWYHRPSGLESFLSAFHRSETAVSLNDKMNEARLSESLYIQSGKPEHAEAVFKETKELLKKSEQ